MQAGDFHELDAVAVDPDADEAGILRAVGLDVNVRGAARGGFENELIGKLDDAGISLVDLVFVFLFLFGGHLSFAEGVEDLGQVGAIGRDLFGLAIRRGDISEDLVLEANPEVVARREVHGSDAVEAREVVRIVDGDDEQARPPLDGRAAVLLPHVGGHAVAVLLRNLLDPVVGEEAGAVERGQRFPQLVFGDVVVLDEDLLDGGVVDARARHGRLDVFLRDDSFVDERAEARWFGLPRGAMLVVKRDPQNPSDLLGGIFVLRREGDAVPFVDELHHAEEVLLEEDRHGQDRFGAEAGLLVPALIEAKVGVELRQLGSVVGILDVDRLPRQRRESCDGGEGLGNADLFRHVTDLGQRVELLVLGVHGVDGQPLGIEELEDLVLERHQDVRDRLRRVDLIGDPGQLLAILELPLERGGRGLHGHGWVSDLVSGRKG